MFAYTILVGERTGSGSVEADMLGWLPKGNCTEERRGASRAMFGIGDEMSR